MDDKIINNNNENNIHFLIQEQEELDKTNLCDVVRVDELFTIEDIDKNMATWFKDSETDDVSSFYNYQTFQQYDFRELSYYIKKAAYNGCEEIYYDENYKVKDLLKICEYYKIDKDIKNLKLKKEAIISTIVFFEKSPENQKIVYNRNLMWAYMEELLKDSNMKKYLLWN